MVLLLGGPAGAGKSTLARAWCGTRKRAVHVELDCVRDLIVTGRADPQEPSATQSEQYVTSVHATCALARTFAESGYDVVLDDVLEPEAFEAAWRPQLRELDWSIVVVLPTLEETLARSRARSKRVQERHTAAQHARSSGWPNDAVLDTTGLSVSQSVEALSAVLIRAHARRT
jgi:predicted kinase